MREVAVAGHSQFKNIMYRKGAQDAKRAKMFTRIGREIIVAARSGLPDPASNPRLRAAIMAAREVNMPKDNIERAIKRATGELGADSYEEIRYEGYGPGGVAVIVETVTDNRNRTAADIRSIFSKAGGAMGETNSVAFQFSRMGQIIYPLKVASADAMFEAALDVGAENVESGEETHQITCAQDDFNAVRDGLEAKFGAASESGLVWIPNNTIAIDGDKAESLFKMLQALDDSDDVQKVAANFEVSDETMAKLNG